MMIETTPWRRATVHDGAVYSNFGETLHRVQLLDGGHFDVYADGFDDTGPDLRFKEGVVRQPAPQTPPYDFLDSVAIGMADIRGIRAIGRELDPLSDAPPFRRVAPNIHCWTVRLRSGGALWVMAHRWRRRGFRILFEVDTVGGREPSVLPVVELTARSCKECPQRCDNGQLLQREEH